MFEEGIVFLNAGPLFFQERKDYPIQKFIEKRVLLWKKTVRPNVARIQHKFVFLSKQCIHMSKYRMGGACYIV